MKIKYNETDISEKVDVKVCIHEEYAEEKADYLRIVFDETSKSWDNWQAEAGDTISIEKDGVSTGILYVKKVIPQSDNFTIKANAMPLGSNNVNNKSWENATFELIGRDIAQRNNLTYRGYGYTNHIYSYVTQSNEKDLLFFERLCVQEGCAMIIHNNSLVVYSEKYIEELENIIELTVSTATQPKFKNKAKFGACTVTNGTYTATYKESDWKEYMKAINFAIASDGEALRFAQNILKYINKKTTTGSAIFDGLLPEIAAASLVYINNEVEPYLSGKAFVTRIRRNYINETSKVYFRMI